MLRSIVLAVIIGMLAGAGCNDKGSDPCPVAHNVYIAARFYDDEGITRDPLYYLDSDSLNVIDSIPNLGAIYDLEVSPDGRWIYALVHRGGTAQDSLKKIDVRLKRVAWSVGVGSHRWTMSLLDGGKLILVNYRSEELVNAETGESIAAFSDSLFRQFGPLTGTEVACVVKGGSNTIRVTDVASGNVRGEFAPRLSTGEKLSWVSHAVLHADQRRVLVIGSRYAEYDSWFVIGDVTTGETLLEHRLFSSTGEVALNESATLAIVSDPGVTGLFEGPYPAQLFDLVEMKHVRDVMITGKQFRFLPGEQRVIDAPSPDYWSVTPPRVFNLSTFSLEKLVWMPDSVSWLGALGIGPRPCP